MMEMAKVTSKGQITIPVSIRKRLNINEGDKLLFIDSPDGVIMVNPDKLHGAAIADTPTATDAAAISSEAPLRTAAAPQTDPAPQNNTAPHAAPSAPGRRSTVPAGKEEARVGGLDVGALLDEIRSIGSKI